MFPVKFISDNLIWNFNNECFAYYELLPFNYNFLSYDEKQQLHENFRQLISQSKTGQIHLLQIATKRSISNIQNKCKRYVSGKLKDIAYKRIDEQTKALVSMIGDNQVDYRFFIGFKLIPTDEELSLSSFADMVKVNLKSFIYDVNHKAMGDYIKMPKEEIRRFAKLEKLLKSKISRRFKVRSINKDDYGYLLEHIYAQDLEPFEDYEFYIDKKKLEDNMAIKRYDLLKPARCMLIENQKHIQFLAESKTSYVSYMTINTIIDELQFPSCEIFYYQQQQFSFPVDTSIHVEIIDNKQALTTVRNKKRELKDLDDHAFNSNNETGKNVEEALNDVDELEADLSQSKESMYKLSYVVRIQADSLSELNRRCEEVRDFYDDLRIKLVRPFGDMLGLHNEFIPASKRYISDYVQYVTSDFIASLGFGAAQMLGETDGIYIGYNVDTGKNVYIQPWLACQGVEGSITNSLSAAFLGSLGGGKSLSNNLIDYYAVLYGAKALILDPKSERGKWKDMLEGLGKETNIVNLTNDIENKGLLDPFVIMQDVSDGESLAVDILTFLTGINSRDGKRFPPLRKAIKDVANSERRGLLCVIESLRSQGTDIADSIAEHINSFTDYDFARLLFSDGTVEKSISLEKQLNIVQIADLVLPDKGSSFEEYTTRELLSISMLIAISTFALDFIKSDRKIFKLFVIDEAWSMLNVQQGRTLADKLVRAGRSMNAGVYFITQNSVDVGDETIKNNIGMKFAFRSTDIEEIKKTLEFFNIDSEDEDNQNALRNLEIGQCLMADIYGRVGVVQIHPVFEELLEAFDTKPPRPEEMSE